MEHLFSTDHIKSIKFVRRFPFDPEIRRKQFEFEDAVKGHFPNPPQVASNQGQLPPDAPRFIFTDGKKVLVVAGTAVQLTLNFPDGLPKQNSLKNINNKYSEIFDTSFKSILQYQSKFYNGYIITFNKKIPEGVHTVARIVSDQLLSINLDNIQAANIDIGFTENELTHTFGISGYKNITTQLKLGESIFIDPDFDDQNAEIGLQLIVDTNNKQHTSHEVNFKTICEKSLYIISEKAPSIIKSIAPKLD